jgi:hypothetical protein
MQVEMKLTVRPLTPNLWPTLEDLFGKKGACNRCRLARAFARESKKSQGTIAFVP